MTTIKIGLVGLGSIGKVHEDVLTSKPLSDFFKLTAICDREQKTTNLPFYKSYQKFLTHPDLQAVSIATPLHYELALEAIKAGKNILLEKPPTLTLEQLKTIDKAGKEAGVTVFTAYHSCYRPEVDMALRELKGKKVSTIKIVYREDVLHYCDPNGWIFKPQIAGGGVFMSSGINPVSILMKILPNLDFKVEQAELDIDPRFNLESKGLVTFTFGGGRGTIDMDWYHDGAETRLIEIVTDDGLYTIDIVKSQLLRDGKILFGGDDSNRQTVDQHIEYRGVYQKFCDLINSGQSLVLKRELALILDIYKAVM